MDHTTEKFLFEKLDAYCVARDALRTVIQYKAKMRGLPGELAGQLERAAVSTVANICEAVGRVGAGDRRQRFAIARGEANEAGGLIEIVRLYSVFSDDDYRVLRSSFMRVTFMLTALMR